MPTKASVLRSDTNDGRNRGTNVKPPSGHLNQLELTTRSFRSNLLRRVVGTAVLLFIVIGVLWPIHEFLMVALARCTYPFDLEWMEGAIADHVRVLLAGEPLYRKPSLEFTPFIYAPGYYYVSAIATKLLGYGMLGPRVISLVSTLGSFVTIGTWVFRETRCVLASLVAASLYAASFGLSEYWFDIARCDSLFVFLLLLGYQCARFANSVAIAICTGLLLGACAMTKQVGLILALPALGFVILQSRKLGVWAFATFMMFVGCCVESLEQSTGGWFSFYAFRLPAEHPIHWRLLRSTLTTHFFRPLFPMACCAIAVVLGVVPQKSSRIGALYATWILAATGASLVALLHSGGYPNVLMPFHAAIAVASGLVLASLWGSSRENGHAPFGLRALALGVVAMQMSLLPPIRRTQLVPTGEDEQSGRALIATLQNIPGEVWILSSGHYPLLAHKAAVKAHAMALTDVFKSREEGIKQQLMREVLEQIRKKRFSAIVLDRVSGFLPRAISDEIRAHYRISKVLQSSDDSRFWPKSGAAVRPDELWVRAP